MRAFRMEVWTGPTIVSQVAESLRTGAWPIVLAPVAGTERVHFITQAADRTGAEVAANDAIRCMYPHAGFRVRCNGETPLL